MYPSSCAEAKIDAVDCLNRSIGGVNEYVKVKETLGE